MDVNYETVLLNSGGPGVTGPAGFKAGDFTTQLSQAMILNGTWEACLVEVVFRNPFHGVTGLTPVSIYVLCDMLDNSYVANNQQPLLFATRPIGPDDPLYISIQHTSTITQWKRINRQNVQSIRIIVQDSTGNIINDAPAGQPAFATTVQFIMRQTSDA